MKIQRNAYLLLALSAAAVLLVMAARLRTVNAEAASLRERAATSERMAASLEAELKETVAEAARYQSNFVRCVGVLKKANQSFADLYDADTELLGVAFGHGILKGYKMRTEWRTPEDVVREADAAAARYRRDRGTK